jgi:hypothetical protein
MIVPDRDCDVLDHLPSVVVPLEICEDCTIEEPVAEDGTNDEPMKDGVTAELDTQPVIVPVVAMGAEVIVGEVPEVPKTVEEVSEV